ncbi:MAG: hypothetical protein SGPRY_013276 [Prymnesium sp.]
MAVAAEALHASRPSWAASEMGARKTNISSIAIAQLMGTVIADEIPAHIKPMENTQMPAEPMT